MEYQKTEPFENLDRPPDDPDHDKKIKVIVKNVEAVGICNPKTSVPYNDDSVDSAPGIQWT